MEMLEENIEVKEQEVIDGVIYKATNIISQKVYIGLTKHGMENRKKSHYSRAKNKYLYNTYFHRALNRYGEDCFTWEVIDTATTQKELNEKEVYWIAYYNSYGDGGYNLTYGGEGNNGFIKPSWKGKRKVIKRTSPISQKGELSNVAKLTEKDVFKIRELIMEGQAIGEIAKKFNVSDKAIRGIKGGYTWTHILSKEDVELMNNCYRQLKIFRTIRIKELLIAGVKTIKEIADVENVKVSTVNIVKIGGAWRDVITDEDVILMNKNKNGIKRNSEKFESVMMAKDMIISGELLQKEISEITGLTERDISKLKHGELWGGLFSNEDKMKLLEKSKQNPRSSSRYKEQLKNNAKANSKGITKNNKEIATLKRKKKQSDAIKTKNMLIEGNKTIKEIAEELGVTESFIYRIKSGDSRRDIITDEDVEKMNSKSIKRSGLKKEVIMKIKDTILEDKLSVEEIASLLGVSKSVVSNIKGGRQRGEMFTEEERAALKKLNEQ